MARVVNNNNQIYGSVTGPDTLSAEVTSDGDVISTRLTPQKNLLVTNYRINLDNFGLNELADVDTTNVSDGALLTYSGTSSKWEAKTEIINNNTIINGGGY